MENKVDTWRGVPRRCSKIDSDLLLSGDFWPRCAPALRPTAATGGGTIGADGRLLFKLSENESRSS